MDESARLDKLESIVTQLAAQNEFLATTLTRIAAKLDPITVDHSTQAMEFLEPRHDEPTAEIKESVNETSSHHVKPSPPLDFDGDRKKGRAFMNSCKLYICLAKNQFSNDQERIAWVYSFMKSGRAALFVDRVLRCEARTCSPMFAGWMTFRVTFMDEFCPKNETQMALAHLETSAYHQSKCAIDDYIDEFHDLIDMAGYTEGLVIVIKFCKGLQSDIQDQIVQLPYGHPDDDNPDEWYEAAT
jgi:hypothetical protein